MVAAPIFFMAGEFGAAFFNLLNRDKMINKTFTVDNLNSFIRICNGIVRITETNNNGDLMASQLLSLASLIKDFIAHPVVKNSGIIESRDMRDKSITLLQLLTNACGAEFEDEKLAVDIIEETLKNV